MAKKMTIVEFLNLFKTIVDTNESIGCPTSSEYHNIVYRINNSTELEPVYDTLDGTFVESALNNLKNMPLAGVDWIDWSTINSDPLTRKYWVA